MEDDTLDFAEAIGEPHRACDRCGKVDSTAFCRDDNHEEDPGEHLCFDCAKDEGYCFGCGHFCAGMESFDFSPIKGYCANCTDQIKSTVVDDDEDYYDEYDDNDDGLDDYCPSCRAEYDAIDREYQICHHCGHENDS